jgi:hypothetical protein
MDSVKALHDILQDGYSFGKRIIYRGGKGKIDYFAFSLNRLILHAFMVVVSKHHSLFLRSQLVNNFQDM